MNSGAQGRFKSTIRAATRISWARDMDFEGACVSVDEHTETARPAFTDEGFV